MKPNEWSKWDMEREAEALRQQRERMADLFPELVRALEEAEGKLEAWASGSSKAEPSWSKMARERARAALAKAEEMMK